MWYGQCLRLSRHAGNYNYTNYNKHLLRRAQLVTSYPLEDVTVLGITTTLKSYKLAWIINQAASLRLARATDRDYNTSENFRGDVLYFLFKTEHCTFSLAKNGLHSPEGNSLGYLFPKFKQFDFFFIVQDATSAFQHEAFCSTLSATQQVTYIAHLPANKWHQTDLLSVLDC